VTELKGKLAARGTDVAGAADKKDFHIFKFLCYPIKI
jgi:hypothetical protein